MKRIIILLATILLITVSAFAQIEGRVTDAKGNGVPKVTITATGADGKVASTATTDEDGEYVFEDLDVGKYKITAKGSEAFQPTVRENVNVLENETTTLDIMLLPAVQPQPATNPTPPQIKQKKLYVGNLSYQTTENDLTSLFEQVGEVICGRIVTAKDTGRSKGFGFIVMSAEDADKAIAQFNGMEVNARAITVNEVRTGQGSSSGGNLDCRN
jgi:cold-inducible RNA-binding protein